jgi:hypothetical protein
MARCLHLRLVREELAEDPFRGLRAGPADFSPFLCLSYPFRLLLLPFSRINEISNQAQPCRRVEENTNIEDGSGP